MIIHTYVHIHRYVPTYVDGSLCGELDDTAMNCMGSICAQHNTTQHNTTQHMCKLVKTDDFHKKDDSLWTFRLDRHLGSDVS
jgi:hypothetical protein